jgi:hypothetical protein
MKKFLKRIILLSIPVWIFFLIPAYILWQTGEYFTPIDEMINSNRKYLIGYEYNEGNYYYLKWKESIRKEYDIITIGASRVLQFRDSMFNASFYNAGYVVASIKDYKSFLETIDYNPEYVILGLEHFYFRKGYKSTQKQKKTFTLPQMSAFIIIWKDIIAGKITYKSGEITYKSNKYNFVKSNDIAYIGLNAIKNNSGFTKDGSLYYGKIIHNLIYADSVVAISQFNDVFNCIKQGVGWFQHESNIDEKMISQIKELLAYCQSHNIKVIAFLPPFTDMVYSKMMESGHYQYVTKIYLSLKPIFEDYHFELYDFSSAMACQSYDHEFLDGCHGSEVVYMRILLNMLHQGSVLSNVVDSAQLQIDLAHKRNSFSVYEH